ncbi:MAG TPA: FHA domain-containing protein [Anaerolineae bacterium]|nr:FHA domain-containing protein [Anaerolineae bacterium]
MITCPNCHTENQAGSAFCDNCGFALANESSTPQATAPSPAAASPSASPLRAQKEMIKCAVCGTENDPSNTYCENCGSPLTAPAASASNSPLPLPTPTASATPSSPAPAVSTPPPTASAPAQPAPNVNLPDEIPASMLNPAPPAVMPTPVPNVRPKIILPTPSNQPPPAGHPRLVLVSSGTYFDLDGYSELLIGRVDPTSDIFPEVDLTAHGGDEGGVSRRHARITLAGNQYFVEDLDSSNGSWLGTSRLVAKTRTPLNHGDQLRLGKLVLNFFAS